MSTAAGPRHSSLKHKVPVGKVAVEKKTAQKEEKMTEIAQSAEKLFTFTIDARTAQVVKFETLDASGARHGEVVEIVADHDDFRRTRAGCRREGMDDVPGRLRPRDRIVAEDVRQILDGADPGERHPRGLGAIVENDLLRQTEA